MNGLPNDVTQTLRKKLEDQKRHISARISELTAQDPFSDPERVNDNAASDHEASEESSHDRFDAMIKELQANLTDVDGALVRIGNGTFGVCANCGKPIAAERLQILPTATLCLTCERLKS